MLFILQRYIFKELFRVFFMATFALVLMLSLGIILRPVQEYGIGPKQVISLIGLFLPVTLSMVLPISALFAASLVYGRFAYDNEYDACKASGISPINLLYPAIILALAVSIANLLLSFHVVPAFVHRAESSLKSDAQQILFRNIQRSGYYQMPDGRYLIYADAADLENETLTGVIITEKRGPEISRIITAEQAKLSFIPHEHYNQVEIKAVNTHQMDAQARGGFFTESLSLTAQFGSLMGDSVKFKQVEELKQIAANPMNFYPIAQDTKQLLARFTAEMLAQNINKTLENGNEFKLTGMPVSVSFTADSCQPIPATAGNLSENQIRELNLLGNVKLTRFDTVTGKTLETFTCQKADIYLEGDELAPTLTISLYNPEWQNPDGTRGLASRRTIRGLIIPDAVTRVFKTDSYIENTDPALIEAALENVSPEIQMLQNRLKYNIERTLVRVVAEVHSRLVFGIGCVSLIIVGASLGILKKGGHLLTAFGTSIVPAALLIIFIVVGKSSTKNLEANVNSGVMQMYLGLIIVTILALLLLRKLHKN